MTADPTVSIEAPRSPERVLGDSPGEKAAAITIGLAALALAVTGMTVSFTVVNREMADYFGHLAFAVPLGVDLAILVFSSADLLQTFWRMNIRWVRLTPAAFTAATVYMNVKAGGPGAVLVAHAAMPSLWVVFIEFVRTVIQLRITQVDQLPDKQIPIARWLLTPWSTWKLWRRMKLWHLEDYPEALKLEAQRAARSVYLEHTYGSRWLRNAPRQEVLAERLLRIAPVNVAGTVLTRLTEEDFTLASLLSNLDRSPAPPQAQRPGGPLSTETTGAISRQHQVKSGSPFAELDRRDETGGKLVVADAEPGRRDLPKMRRDSLTVWLAYRDAGRALTARRLAQLTGYSTRQASRRLDEFLNVFGESAVTTREDDATFAKDLAERIADGLELVPADETVQTKAPGQARPALQATASAPVG